MPIDQANQLAALHACVFDGIFRWSPEAFDQALGDPRCFVVSDDENSVGFALGRIAADEVELLTLIVAPEHRRTGLGRSLLAQFEDEALVRGAEAAFLEVAQDNIAARELYENAGWRSVGKRPAYYGGVDAIVMRKPLTSL